MGLRLLHIISGDLWAGAEAMAYQLLTGLNRRKSIDLHLIILNEGRLERLCRKEGITCYLFNEQEISFPSLAYKALKIARKIKPDIIHSHRYKENILAALIAPGCGLPKLIATQHGRTEVEDTSILKRIFRRVHHTCLQRRFAQVVAVSNDTANYLIQSCGLKGGKLTVIRNGIEPPSIQVRFNRKSSHRPFTVGSAGRLFPVKNFTTLIEIASQVCEMKPHIRFVIAGEGPERSNLSFLIAKHNLDKNVHLIGHVDDMQDFYNKLDLYINTSLHEGTPMSILEAMANGLPVIAFDVAGLKEIITDGADGFTISESDKACFSYRILELVDNPRKLEILGKFANRKIIKFFSTRRMVNEYQESYQRICK